MSAVQILEDDHIENNIVELHRHEADLWVCLSGEVTFQVGGKMPGMYAKKLPDGGTDDREMKSETIEGAETYVAREGDTLWIPAGVPHVHNTKTNARLFVIKIPQELVPLATALVRNG